MFYYLWLNNAYHMQTQPEKGQRQLQVYSHGKTEHFILVSAGMSGLSAVYELTQVGHKVTDLLSLRSSRVWAYGKAGSGMGMETDMEN